MLNRLERRFQSELHAFVLFEKHGHLIIPLTVEFYQTVRNSVQNTVIPEKIVLGMEKRGKGTKR